MAAAVDPRKRSREEDVNEFMPLSKRINNLHLNAASQQGFAGQEHNPGTAVGLHMPFLEGHHVHLPPVHHYHHPHQLAGHSGGSSSSGGSSCHSIPSGGSSPSGGSRSGLSLPRELPPLTVNGELLGDYCPDLAEHENPHYFDRNKLLYELYVERMRRLQ
ncbi:uncharacterized protein LOC129755261 [Uranotaenia lowii]|uniref:uncharacterized protein LOC129755261 n=1 Tax=Uranotaenia lowii TaxID=190385 RepID=UPI00247A8220|nr:uncharacterized protein LOC129755261 [Uranotaenia lowii]